jgi:hypothetical protein
MMVSTITPIAKTLHECNTLLIGRGWSSNDIRKKNPIAAAEGYQEQQGNNDEGEATRLSSESGIADGKGVRQNVESGNAEGDHARQSAESGGDRKTQGIDAAQSTVDVMLSDLFPSYVPSQRPTLDPIQEKDRLLEGASLSTIPFQNFTRDTLQSPQREDANCSFETKPSAPSADRDGPVPNDAASLENSTTERVVVPTILPRLNDPSEKKQKVSYKDLVNQMLNFD